MSGLIPHPVSRLKLDPPSSPCSPLHVGAGFAAIELNLDTRQRRLEAIPEGRAGQGPLGAHYSRQRSITGRSTARPCLSICILRFSRQTRGELPRNAESSSEFAHACALCLSQSEHCQPDLMAGRLELVECLCQLALSQHGSVQLIEGFEHGDVFAVPRSGVDAGWRGACSFCGEDLREVPRYVVIGPAVICIRTASPLRRRRSSKRTRFPAERCPSADIDITKSPHPGGPYRGPTAPARPRTARPSSSDAGNTGDPLLGRQDR